MCVCVYLYKLIFIMIQEGFFGLYLALSVNKYVFITCALTVSLCGMSYFRRTGVFSELLSLLPGGRLKVFGRCMVDACSKFKIVFIF